MSMYLKVGTILKDAKNEYIVKDMEHRNTHSQFPSAYLVECYSGPNEGKACWVSAQIALMYQGEWKHD